LHFIVMANVISQVCGDVKHSIIRNAQSEVKKGVHKISFSSLCVDHDAQIDRQWCLVFSTLCLEVAAVFFPRKLLYMRSCEIVRAGCGMVL
jgi:hypothetical protein